MIKCKNSPGFKGHRFPPEIIEYAVWLYFRFSLSHRDVEDLLAERSIIISHEAIRFWVTKFDRHYAKSSRHAQQFLSAHYLIDVLFRPSRHRLTAKSYRHAISNAFVICNDIRREIAAG